MILSGHDSVCLHRKSLRLGIFAPLRRFTCVFQGRSPKLLADSTRFPFRRKFSRDRMWRQRRRRKIQSAAISGGPSPLPPSLTDERDPRRPDARAEARSPFLPPPGGTSCLTPGGSLRSASRRAGAALPNLLVSALCLRSRQGASVEDARISHRSFSRACSNGITWTARIPTKASSGGFCWRAQTFSGQPARARRSLKRGGRFVHIPLDEITARTAISLN